MAATSFTAEPPAHTVKPLDPAQYRPALVNVGTIVWLASELMFFSGLFAAFMTLRAATPVWPPDGDKLDVVTVGIATVILVLSSGTMQMAVRRAHMFDRVGFWGWLALTFCLGATFDGLQISDYIGRNFAISQSAYSGAFYVLTGIHALHVAGGLMAMVVMFFRSLNPRIRFGGPRSSPAVDMLSYYWHFVDVVWIGLYAMIFILK